MNNHSVDGRDTIETFKHALLAAPPPGDDRSSGSAGSCFLVGAQRQVNVCIVVARGLQLPADTAVARQQLREVASYVASEVGYNFPAGSRSCKGYQPL